MKTTPVFLYLMVLLHSLSSNCGQSIHFEDDVKPEIDPVLRKRSKLFDSSRQITSKIINKSDKDISIQPYDSEDLTGRIGLVGDELHLSPVPGSPYSANGGHLNHQNIPLQHLKQQVHHPECYCSLPDKCLFREGFDGTGLIDIRIVNRFPSHNGHEGSTNSGGFKCPAGQLSCCPPEQLQDQCPASPLARRCGERTIIPVGGAASDIAEAKFGAYPWISTVLSQKDRFVASAALIEPQWVLTVAHRVAKYARNPSAIKVRFGEWDASDPNREPCPYQERGVSQVIIHGYYDPGSLRNDVALLRLTAPIDLQQNAPHINSVCLPGVGENFDGNRCWLAGFGKNAFGRQGNYSYVLKEVDLRVVDHYRCQNKLRQTSLGRRFVLDQRSFICAGGEVGKDACEGDGGAPLVCLTDRGWTVAGLVAWGVGCAEYNTPGVYVNVQNYHDWIRYKLGYIS